MRRNIVQQLVCTLFVLTASVRCNPDKKNLLPNKQLCGHQLRNSASSNDTLIDAYPWMALLFYENQAGKLNHYCAGSLINNRYVLTAATCLKAHRSGLNLKFVRLGEYDTSNAGADCFGKKCADLPLDIEIEETILHDRYSNFENDIGLIRLAKHVTFSDYIRPICLPEEGGNLEGFGDELISAGWGVSSQSAGLSITKKSHKTLVIGPEECTNAINRKIIISDKEICVKHLADGPCNGDSGAPLMSSKNQQWYQHGIVAFGNSPCGLGAVTVGPRISNYINWIVSNLKQ